jgi:hypothetical protein
LDEDGQPRPELMPFVEYLAEWIAEQVLKDPALRRYTNAPASRAGSKK